jgi:hypothetical protein
LKPVDRSKILAHSNSIAIKGDFSIRSRIFSIGIAAAKAACANHSHAQLDFVRCPQRGRKLNAPQAGHTAGGTDTDQTYRKNYEENRRDHQTIQTGRSQRRP